MGTPDRSKRSAATERSDRTEGTDRSKGAADSVGARRDLVISPCRSECSWSPTGADLAGEPLFACAACGSEWVASEVWTPVDWQGEVPQAVRAERARTSAG